MAEAAVLERKDARRKDGDSETKGLFARMGEEIDAYLNGLDEKTRKKAEAVVVPTTPTKELLTASWDAAADATNEYSRATALARAGNQAEADRIVEAAKAHFATLEPEVRAGALFVIQVQAEQEYADYQAGKR